MSGIATARRIDLHAHVVLPETMGAAGRFGPALLHHPDARPYFQIGDYCLEGVRYEGTPFMDPELRIAAMEKAGIDFQVLSPNPLTYFHFIDDGDAIAYCRTHNDALAKLVKRYPQYFGGLAALPMQEPEAAIAELRRSVWKLGLWGAALGTDMPYHLDAAELDPVYATAVELDVPLFVHPAPAGIDGPGGDPRLKRFELDLIVGFAGQETIAVAVLIFGGVLDRHPKLDLWISHGGGATVLMKGRMAKAAETRSWSPLELRPPGAFAERLKRLWYDTHLGDADALDLLVRTVGTERLTFGTNFAGWDQPKDGAYDVSLDMLADNARRLLRQTPERIAAR